MLVYSNNCYLNLISTYCVLIVIFFWNSTLLYDVRILITEWIRHYMSHWSLWLTHNCQCSKLQVPLGNIDPLGSITDKRRENHVLDRNDISGNWRESHDKLFQVYNYNRIMVQSKANSIHLLFIIYHHYYSGNVLSTALW